MISSKSPALRLVKWQHETAGIWTLFAGKPESLTPLGVAGGSPLLNAIRELGEPKGAAPPAASIETVHGRIVVSLPIDDKEALFGLGLQFHRVNHRGRTRTLRVNSDPKEDTGETHAPVPLLISSRGYGMLVDSARIVSIYCGSTVRADSKNPPDLRDRGRDPLWEATPRSEAIEIVIPSPGAKLYYFAGPTPLDAVRRYVLFCGGGALPPRWGLGFWHRVRTDATDHAAAAEAQEYRKRDFPCDVIGLEPGWHSSSYPCTYEWGADRFPHPAAFVEQMTSLGFHVNLWEHPYVSPRASVYPALQPYSGSHTVWGGLAPDYTVPEAQQLLARQHDREHVSIGVSGYKLDECDGSELTGASWMFPAHASYPSGHDGEQVQQVYGLAMQRLTTELFRRRDRRTYGLVRAGNAGGAPLPYVLYSDLYDHRQYVRALCNSGFSGLLWTPEIRSASSAEDWARRMQTVCLSPLAMLNGWSDGTHPWSFPEVEPVVRKYLKLRMRLMPYLYSAFARYHFEGTPPFRPMALEPGMHNSEIDDQYMVGDSLLVAPLFAGQRSREVHLPPGAWIEFETGERAEGGQAVTVTPGIERIPIFVRNGGIVPLMPARDNAPHGGERVDLEILHFGDADGRFRLYDDDGETFAYERGAFQWRTIEITAKNGELARKISAPEPGKPSTYGEIAWTRRG